MYKVLIDHTYTFCSFNSISYIEVYWHHFPYCGHIMRMQLFSKGINFIRQVPQSTKGLTDLNETSVLEHQIKCLNLSFPRESTSHWMDVTQVVSSKSHWLFYPQFKYFIPTSSQPEGWWFLMKFVESWSNLFMYKLAVWSSKKDNMSSEFSCLCGINN